MENKKRSRILHIVSPFIVMLICSAVVLCAMIKPYDKIRMYMHLAFMDELKNTPETKNSGLVIKDNNIITDYSGETSDEGEIIRPAFGEMYAVLETDALETEVPVYWGCNSELLDRGACQSTGSIVIGDKGNTVISAHVDTFFASLEKIKEGDKVTLRTNYGEFIYTVKEKIQFLKSDGKYVSPTDDDRLTLYTCKRDILGNMDERTGVICELTEKNFYQDAKEDSADE